MGLVSNRKRIFSYIISYAPSSHFKKFHCYTSSTTSHRQISSYSPHILEKITMQHISSTSLSSLPSRIAYLSSFLSLTPSDTEALLAAKPLVAPLIPTILDAVYTKLLSYDITAKAFVPKSKFLIDSLIPCQP
jgi:hypothetical protein